MRQAALLLVAAATVTPVSSFPEGPISLRTSHEVAPLDAVASRLAGRSVHVNCWSNGDWTALVRREARRGVNVYADAAAFTNIERAQIQIAPPTCAALAEVLRGRGRELDVATALGVLAHEASHTAGVRSESRAECEAVRTLPRAARLVGIARARARRLQHVYRGMVYPLDLERYRSKSCRAGLPGIVIPNEFGPDDRVAALRARLRAIRSALPSWRSYPSPLGLLGNCSVVSTRVHELARVEEVLRSNRTSSGLDVAAVEFDSPGIFREAAAHLGRSIRCSAAAARRRLHVSDPRADVAVAPLPEPLRRSAPGIRGARVTTRTSRPRAATVYQDEVFVLDPGARVLVVLTLAGHDRPVALALEKRVLAAVAR